MNLLRDRRSAQLLFALGSALLLDCNSAPASSDAFVLAPDLTGDYDVVRRALPVRDVRTLDNDLFAFEARSKLSVAYPEVRATDAEPVELKTFGRDGAHFAGDYDALLSLSAAHHLFASRAHFDSIGLDELQPTLPRFRVVLFPYREAGGEAMLGSIPTEDNAFFAKSLGGFAILHENVLDALPIAANLGVIAHEFSHAVFSHLVHRSASGDGVELLFRALNEGLADVHGAALSSDPAFVRRSAPGPGADRDLTQDHVYDAIAAEKNFSNPYWYGTIVASTFWSYRAALIQSRSVTPEDATRRMSRAALMGVANFTLEQRKDGEITTRADLERPFWAGFVAEAKVTGDEDLFCASIEAHFAQLPKLYEGICP